LLNPTWAGFGDNTEKMNIAIETLHLPNGQKENVMNDWKNNVCAPANIGTTIISERKGNKSTISGIFSNNYFYGTDSTGI